MSTYRKKPIAVQAFRYWPVGLWPAWFEGAVELGEVTFSRLGINRVALIHTLEGTMQADPGDWVIQGVKGELYPCKHDVFVQTYELVEDCVQQGGAK